MHHNINNKKKRHFLKANIKYLAAESKLSLFFLLFLQCAFFKPYAIYNQQICKKGKWVYKHIKLIHAYKNKNLYL